MYTPRKRLTHQIGAGVYTDAPPESNHALFVHVDAVYVNTPRQRFVQQIGVGVYTETPSESTQPIFVHPDAV